METASFIGRTLDHYRIVEKIGAGGMGEVYRAHDERLDRDVALKLLPSDALADHAARQRFRREAQALSRLNHPNIATIHDFDSEDGVDFLVMEYVVGATLEDKLKAGRFAEKETIRVGVQIARALEEAHENSVVHRDLKAANVMMSPRGDVKVLDFGLASLVAPLSPSMSTLTSQIGTPVGTLPYMAPEILRGEFGDERSDIWSLGVTLYELVSGRRPFQARTAFELSSQILEQEPAPLPVDVSPALRSVIFTCLAKRPQQRYKRAGEARAALETLLSETSVIALAQPAARRARLWMGIAAALAIAAVAISATLLLRLHRASEFGKGGQLSLLLSSEASIETPALSPDGQSMVYVAEDNGQFDLFLSRVAGGGRIRLTNDSFREATPTFSADGERVAFARLRASSTVPEICTVPALGGEITTLVATASSPRFSPDGRRLAYVRMPPNAPMELVNAAADGSDPRVLLTADDLYPFLGSLAWSPDSSLLAVTRRTGGMAAELWVVPSAGGPLRRLTHDPPNIFSQAPAFTPDGSGVVHSSNRAGATNLWIAPVDGGTPTRLTSGTGPDDAPSIAGNGSVVFVNSRWRDVLLVHEIETGKTREIARHTGYVWAPSFSPDGREVAYSYFENQAAWHIWIAALDGSTPPRRLTSGADDEIYSRFAPDGATLLFSNWPGRGRVWRVSRDGGAASAVTSQEGDSLGDVSPDGRLIAFARKQGEKVRVFIAPLAGGAARQLTTSPSTIPRWSPDGKFIVFAAARSLESGISVIRADGSGERRITSSGSWPVWWPDGSRIAYLDVARDGMQEMRTIRPDGGDSRVVPGLRWHGNNSPIDIARDGKSLATSDSVHLEDDVWLLKPPR